MTDDEFQNHVMPAFRDLWPRAADKLTDEQQMSFFRVLQRRTVHDAVSALRGWSDTSKWPPKPSDLHAAARQVTQAGNGDQKWTNADVLRHRWSHQHPGRAGQFAEMSDADVEEYHHWMLWEMAEAAVGAGMTSSAYPAWVAWQNAMRWAGNRPKDSAPSRDEYEDVEVRLNRHEMARRYGWNPLDPGERSAINQPASTYQENRQ